MTTALKDECINALIDALTSPFLDIRKAAIKCLVRLGDERAISPIIQSIRDIPSEDEETIFEYISDIFIGLCFFYDHSIIQQLASILDETFEDLYPLIEYLTTESEKEVVQYLAEHYECHNLELQEIIMGAYSIQIKTFIVYILREMNTIDSNYILLNILKDPDSDEYLLEEAITALGMNQWAPAFEPLCEIVLDKNRSDEESRSAAALALGRIGDPRAIPFLVKAVSDPTIDNYSWLVDSVSSALEWLADDVEDFLEDDYEEGMDTSQS